MIPKNRTRRIVLYCLILFTTVSIGFVGDLLYKFNHHRNQLNFYIKNSDGELARAELNNIKYFDGVARRWGMSWFANRYMLNSDAAALYEAASDYLVGDYNKVANSEFLKGSNDYHAAHMLGSAKARLLQAEYRSITNPEEKKKSMGKLIQQMLEDVSPYFKKAVESSPEFRFPDPNFDDRLNYDMTSDPDGAKLILEAPLPSKKVILGIPRLPGDKDKDGANGKPGEKRLNEESKPGSGGDTRKKG